MNIAQILSARGQCCVHNGTLYEVGANIENNSGECEKVRGGTLLVADVTKLCVTGHIGLPDG